MSHDLYKISKTSWAVKSHKLAEVCVFETIEKAAALLEELGIAPNEVDMAIMDIYGQGNTHAQFGVKQGNFIFSDKEKLEDLVGTA